MIDLIKKTMLAGIGATVTTKETIEAALHDYVEKGKLSAADAKGLADRIVADGRQEFETAKHDLSQRFHELMKKANLVTREELSMLEKRLAEMEACLKKSADTHAHKAAESHTHKAAETHSHKAAETHHAKAAEEHPHKAAKAHH
jgi:polyhydroxyalkanoate synthesis regulator phasin